MSASLQPAQALVAIFTEPRRVFDAIPRRTMALLPLALMLVGNVLIWIWYYQMVDFSWLQERLIAQNVSVVDDSSRQAAQMDCASDAGDCPLRHRFFRTHEHHACHRHAARL